MKIALVLGSGGARGWAHIGVIQELEARGHTVVAVAGTSIGAVVGGAYAAGKFADLTDWIVSLTKHDVRKMYDWSLGGPGLLKGEKITKAVEEVIGNPRIENLRFPFTAVATDIIAGREVWFQRGPLMTAIRASFSIPTFFWPVRVGDRILADGGILNPLPVEPLLATDFDAVVAVDLRGPALRDPREILRAADAAEKREAENSLGAGIARSVKSIADSDFIQRASAAVEEVVQAVSFRASTADADTAEEGEPGEAREPAEDRELAEGREHREPAADRDANRELGADEPHDFTGEPSFSSYPVESHLQAESYEELPKSLKLLEVTDMAISVMQDQIGRFRAASMPVSVHINIPNDIVGTLDFHEGTKMIEYGREQAVKALDEFEGKLRAGQ